MHTFRFNPVFNQWVLLGGPVVAPLEIKESQLFDIGKRNGFVAASHPRSPFLLEPPAKEHQKDDGLLYSAQPPVGEYELLLYQGEKEFFSWNAKDWDAWIMLAQQRILQFHHNPYLHFVYLSFSTQALNSVDGFQRVGDLIAASHPISGLSVHFDQETAEKLRAKEDIFILEDGKEGQLYVPSAPLHEKEVWYLPRTYKSGFEEINANERGSLARALAVLLPALHQEFPEAPFCLHIHTAMAGMADLSTWWLQLYEADTSLLGPLPVRPLPEAFRQHLHYLLAK